jgi:hypothetical protein
MPYITDIQSFGEKIAAGNYYALFSLTFPNNRGVVTDFLLYTFLIVDDTTMIMMSYDVYFQLTRVAYIPKSMFPAGAP